ncbi:sensor histidine kinase [Paractinoplanes globisporus]|uniref:histidine kinase n=1 Tax=Paractinoplanes globisporus TaxID=113565 RepID=A0ABW6W9W0_9ACTN|nr:sensor histidine kinase [Actinoplanes globisporus]
MSRIAPRHLLTDAALALAMLVVTLTPGLLSAALNPHKPGDPTPFLTAAGVTAASGWWLFSGLVLAGLVLRRQWPVPALSLVAAGTVGHLAIQTKFQLLDLALPLALYTVAATARRRRAALVVLALTMTLTYLGMLAGRVSIQDQQNAAMAAKQAQLKALAGKDPGAKIVSPTSAISVDILVDTSQSVLEMWLLSVAAFAIGDGIRSRRAHLAAVEQRNADLAREERQRAALAVAAERTRITRELHDVVAHGMSVMVVQAQGAQAALERHPDRAADALRHVIDVGRSSLAEMRRLLAAGRADADDAARLTPLPGIGAVPSLVDDLRLAGMPIDLMIEGVPDAVPAAVDLSSYRIVQEALTNTLKHAGPGARARVLLDFHPDRVRVEVADDGRGAAAGEDGHGNGLRGIAERVAMLGGDLETGRGDDGSGFRLTATLPLSADLVKP